MGVYNRQANLTVGLFLLSMACVLFFTGIVLCDQSQSSEVVLDLGMGSQPIYRIEHADESVDVDELIELAHKGSLEKESSEVDESKPQIETPRPDPSYISETIVTVPGSSKPAAQESDKEPKTKLSLIEENAENGIAYVRVPLVSNPPGAEVYIDGMFYGLTPLIVTVEPGSHLVELFLEGYWDWFNIVDLSQSTRTLPVTLSPLSGNGSASPEKKGLDGQEKVNATPASANLETPANATSNNATKPPYAGDFWNRNYGKVLMLVAFLSFLIGSGSVATWVRSRLATSVKINFPRDGEDRWAGLIEGQSNRVHGTKRRIYVLVRQDDDHLQVRESVEPNRDGRWSTRFEVEDSIVYRIYAVVTERPLLEKSYLDQIPSHRAIYEIGPVTGRVASRVARGKN